jgi:hypothetical protein
MRGAATALLSPIALACCEDASTKKTSPLFNKAIPKQTTAQKLHTTIVADLTTNELPTNPRTININGRVVIIPTDEDLKDRFSAHYEKSKSMEVIGRDEDWSLLKKGMNIIIAEERASKENICQLPSGQSLSYDAFAKMPEFSGTLEKWHVHQNLSSLLTKQSFLIKYTTFLSDIQKDNWFKKYEKSPKLLQYLAITAFLEKKITVEELAVICNVAAVTQNNNKQNRITVLNKETIIPYLEKHFFTQECSFINIIKYTDQFSSTKCSKEWLDKFASRSPIERTAILHCSISNSNFTFPGDTVIKITSPTSALNTYSIEHCLFSLPVTLDLCEAIFSSKNKYKPPSHHTLQFGYRKSLQEMIQGRPVAIAGMFAAPAVHLSIGGLLIPTHDIAHIMIDWSNPYSQTCIDLGLKILKNIPNQKEFAHQVLDRVVVPINEDVKEIDWATEFWLSLINFSISWENTTSSNQDIEILCTFLKDLPKELTSKETLEQVDKAFNENKDNYLYGRTRANFKNSVFKEIMPK